MEIRLPVAAVLLTTAMTAGGVGLGVASGMAPIEFAMSRHIGWEADRITHGNTCVVASGHECLSRNPSSEPGGFQSPSSVATDMKTGDLYVADLGNYRIQKLTATGEFIAMFGWDVNETKGERAGATQAEKDVCTAVSGDRCKAGTAGTGAGQFFYPTSVTVDRRTGDVYVLDDGMGVRVDKYTSGGRFLWRIGKDVNERTKGNICYEREVLKSGVKCKAGVPNGSRSLEPGAFKAAQQDGDLLVAGGPEDLLYVGDEHRVQEFDGHGRWRREILLVSIFAEDESSVAAVAVDGAGDLYLVYRVSETSPHRESIEIVRKLNPDGDQVASFPVEPRQPGAIAHIDGLAIDPAGAIAVIGVEPGALHRRFGFVYDAATGRRVGEFAPPSDNDGLTLSGKGDLYVAATDDHEVVAYVPAPPVELVSSPVPCEIEIGNDRAGAFDCALNR
jgi:hypothetical protein